MREYTCYLEGREGVSCNSTAATAALALSSCCIKQSDDPDFFVWIQPKAGQWGQSVQLNIQVELRGSSNSAATNRTERPGTKRWARPASEAVATGAPALATADIQLGECQQSQLPWCLGTADKTLAPKHRLLWTWGTSTPSKFGEKVINVDKAVIEDNVKGSDDSWMIRRGRRAFAKALEKSYS